jgi:hypothetical protein
MCTQDIKSSVHVFQYLFLSPNELLEMLVYLWRMQFTAEQSFFTSFAHTHTHNLPFYFRKIADIALATERAKAKSFLL